MYAASDAAFADGRGSGGLLVIHPCVGTASAITGQVIQLWLDDQVVIAQLELLTTLQGLLCFPDLSSLSLEFGGSTTLRTYGPRRGHEPELQP